MMDTSPPASDSGVVEISAKIMIVAVLVVFFMLVFLFFIHLYAKWYWSRHEDPRTVSWRRRAARQRRSAAATAQRRGLDSSALRSLPVAAYNPKETKEGLECAVCLSEVSEGEKIRLLPKCNHGFHAECIDMWFQSHSTCPLCRNPVVSPQDPSINGVELQEIDASSSSESESDDDSSSYDSPHSIEIPAFPTNVLFWGNEVQVNSLGQNTEEGLREATNEPEPSSSASSSNSTIPAGRPRGALVIDIPRHLCEDCLSQHGGEEAKTPVLTSLRSLKRLLSRGKRVAPSPRGSTSADVEQV